MKPKDLITEFSIDYPNDSLAKFGKNRSFEIITKELSRAIKDLCEIDEDKYKIYGSADNGNWAEIPWIAILDRDITTTTRKGYYVVFLFSKDTKKIYLCLSLGWTQFEEEYGIKAGRLHIKETCEYYARLLGSDSSFSYGDISLEATHNLGKGYELGSILHKSYISSSISDENIIQDMQELLNYYSQLKNLVGDSVLNLDIDGEKYNEQIQNFKKDVALSTFKPISYESIAELMAKAANNPPAVKERLIKQIVRNRKYATYIKQKANYICQVCGRKPFIKINGQPYAEADHIIPLGQKGEDKPENIRCLCAQCHAIITYGSEDEIKRLLA